MRNENVLARSQRPTANTEQKKTLILMEACASLRLSSLPVARRLDCDGCGCICGFSHGQDSTAAAAAAALVDVDFAVICGPARGKEAAAESESECEVADGQTVFDVRRRCNFKITFLPLPVGRSSTWSIVAPHRSGQLNCSLWPAV